MDNSTYGHLIFVKLIETHDDNICADLQMDFDEIKSATDDFSDTNKLGQGGFGVVYKVKIWVNYGP